VKQQLSKNFDFKDIGKLFIDRIEIEITFEDNYDMKEESIITLIKSMPQIKDICFSVNKFYTNKISIKELIPNFGHNIFRES
jgi:hypothetical protein